MSNNGKLDKIIVFTCNWHAYSSLESVGINRQSYSADIVPIRVSCLGRITSGIILKSFESGAKAVCLVGCPEESCQYQNGNVEALKVVEESKALLTLLGLDRDLLTYTLVNAGDSSAILQRLDELVEIIKEKSA